MSFLYLGSPYSNADPMVRQERFLKACHAASRLMAKGQSVFCPIAQSHPIAEVMGPGKATDHAFWMAVDLPILAKADRLVILTLPGWEDSKGIAEETNFAKANGIPIEYLSEDGRVTGAQSNPKPKPTGSILEEAQRLVHGERNADYDHPAVDYECTAAFWRAAIKRRYKIDVPLTPDFACLMMALMKISREAGKHKRDSLVDAAGYIECAAMCLGE